MGCVRDLIDPDNFLKPLTEFQQPTQVTACNTVLHKEISTRVLKNCLSHFELISTLKIKIASLQRRLIKFEISSDNSITPLEQFQVQESIEERIFKQ